MTNDEKFMRLAIKEALKAKEINEVPIGCVIVHDGKVIAKAHNKRETLKSSLAHAEILAISKACKKDRRSLHHAGAFRRRHVLYRRMDRKSRSRG